MKIKVAEIFYSIQGEGKFAGVPSVFLRTFGCNFQCRGFGMPRGQLTQEPEQIAEKVELYKNYEDLPLAATGCDSYASWHPKFKDHSPTFTVDEIVEKMTSLIPNNSWTQPDGSDVHLVITGGEPLLGWQRAYEELLTHPKMASLKNLTFETNGTQRLTDEFKKFLFKYSNKAGCKGNVEVTFSISPKLTISGERWEEAIVPKTVAEYIWYGNSYLKFVVATKEDVEDVDRAVKEYQIQGYRDPVYLMPVGGVPDLYHMTTKDVAELSMRKGYRYSPRLQVDIWRNAWGT